ncbi:MAG: phenylalanine--tRNA ligase subunit alpha [Alphaproteobacteria bacterium]|nr:MAG: phenylalanine--tRNA ligase subunit alpha [Alphaproteobacteria bacterium]
MNEFIQLQDQITKEFKTVDSANQANHFKSKFIGKNGILTELLNQLKHLDAESKKKHGYEINKLKNLVTSLYSSFNENLDQSESIQTDYSIPVYVNKGSLHPLTLAIKQIHEIMQNFGFMYELGPSVEDTYYNFDALNIDHNHPSRDAKETFFTANNVLRTHTTAVQIRALESQKYTNNFRVYSIGDVYRRDDDATHLPMFHQIEGFVIDEEASIATLKYFLLNFLRKFFENDNISIRLRPGYFPFTEPSVEVDVKFENGKWLEILGAGIIRKNILSSYGHKNGFAFGIGLERITMIKFGINNMRNFVTNDYPWLQNYSSRR